MAAVSGLEILGRTRSLVVKVGSAMLVDPASGELRTAWLAGLARDLAAERAAGRQLVLVSSGAIALGRRVLGLAEGALPLEQAQAAAAVGQSRLIRGWEEALQPHGMMTAQVLLTLDDTQNRRRYLNGRATLKALIGMGVVPVVNENDTTATDEIRYGDNDRLAARVALMAGAEVLVLLSDVDGLYSANPRLDAGARHLPEITEITPGIEAMAGDAGSDAARGGMRTKLLAAKTAMQGGCAVAVTRGDVERPLTALARGARATWFLPSATPAAARKQWIAGMKPMGVLVIDAGAVAALRRGKSLLPAGVRRVEGRFERGDPVAIATESGETVGAALAGYSASEARAIAGQKSERIADILGYPGRAALAHRDDMVIWGM
ncbi:MAG TPA: glutamate 5-kinase [Thermohalobaculum sp.]|nr:glutamate 5-kinase [Thermohalobaculum sp.]